MTLTEPNIESASDIGLLELGLPLTAPVNQYGRTARFVSFYVGERLYGITASDVAEVSHPLPVTPLPNSPASLIGISPLRGEIVAVLDLKKLLGDTDQMSNRGKFVILRWASGETLIALPVDKMHEIITVGERDFEPSVDSNALISGQATVGDLTMQILETARIAEALHS